MDEHLLSSSYDPSEDPAEYSLRPRFLREFIGQARLKENLSLFIAAARGRDEPLDHVLLHGPPGLGKTSTAHIIANEMGVSMRGTSGPALEKAGDLVAILTNLEEGSVLFIDEIHRLNRMVEEILYPAMEDLEVDVVIGSGPAARSIKLPVPRFTLVAATTRVGLLSAPLRDRFGIPLNFDFYEADDLCKIVVRSAEILDAEIDPRGASEIARRSRGTPRVANRLLRRVRDYAQVRADGLITATVADEALKMLGVDQIGLDDADRRFLRTLIEKYDGGPAGVNALCATLNEEVDTIEDVYEPFLLKEGLIARTSRGRIATRAAYEHLAYPFPESRAAQQGLF
ncbi:MAG: Holliday junction branch migration DNA helicase RuvB [Capsulimonadaceae bacterium]|nr:Holliday junction branch migration DNA helicase RuvB [Capsulimonadaceae bacterium]